MPPFSKRSVSTTNISLSPSPIFFSHTSTPSSPPAQFSQPAAPPRPHPHSQPQPSQFPRHPSPSPHAANRSSPQSGYRKEPWSNGDKIERLVEKLVREMMEMREETTQQLNQMKAMLSETMGQGGLNMPVPKAQLPDSFSWPLSSLEEAQRLNLLLADDETAKKKMFFYLLGLGGRSAKHMVKSIMSTLLATPLARQMNFCGTKGKQALRDLHCVVRLIYDTVRHKFEATSENDIRDIVAAWLTGARDRDNGRKDREGGNRNGQN